MTAWEGATNVIVESIGIHGSVATRVPIKESKQELF